MAVVLGTVLAAGAQAPSGLFKPDAILPWMIRVDDWQRAHPSMPPEGRNWERGTWYTGVMAAYHATGQRRFLDQAQAWGRQHQWREGGKDSPANKLTCVQTWVELYLLDQDRKQIEPAIQWLNSGASNTPSGQKLWYLEGGRRYADSLYVGPPALAMLAQATGERKYLDWMNAFYWDVQGELFDPKAGLFYRDRRFIGATNRHGQKIIWSRGNGWVFAGLPRILDHLPKTDPGYGRYVELLKTMAASLAKRQGADGLWRPNLADPGEFPMKESSGTGFFCYGLAWGIRSGVLDRATYLPVVEKAWAGLVSCVSPAGQVQWGQLAGDRGVEVQAENTHEHVTGSFLLAASEVYRLSQSGLLKGPAQ